MMPSTQAWLAGGERVGYDPKARAMVATDDAPLRIFKRREGILAQAVFFLPGFPDDSFWWTKVRSHLPNAAEMANHAVKSSLVEFPDKSRTRTSLLR